MVSFPDSCQSQMPQDVPRFCVVWEHTVCQSTFKHQKKRDVHKISPVTLGPEMAAPILWAPGIFWFFLLENPHAHKIPPFKGGVLGFLEGGVEVAILFLWAWGFFRLILQTREDDISKLEQRRAIRVPMPGPPKTLKGKKSLERMTF